MIAFKSAAFVLLLIAPSVVYAEASVGLSVEQFTWTEKSDTGTQLLQEQGARYAAHLTWMNTQQPDYSYGYLGKAYLGRVNYSGQTQAGAPAFTTTLYGGSSHELQLNIHPQKFQGKLSYVAGLGLDSWQRAIDNTPYLDQIEQYDLLYFRTAVVFQTRTETHWHFNGGMKYPVLVNERVDGVSNALDQNLTLRPKGNLSFYGEVVYKIGDSPWQASLYYDSYRLGRSDGVVTTSGGKPVLVHQPKSDMDIIGMGVSLKF